MDEAGTSLMGGILHQAGYYMGENLYPPRHSNPRGFFENAFINQINENILTSFDYNKLNQKDQKTETTLSPFSPGDGHRWLTYINKDVTVSCKDESVLNDIRHATSQINYAYKDPRFNYTLGTWYPFVDNSVIFICIFREPEVTIRSVLLECSTAEYLSGFSINAHIAERIWSNSYLHLLNHYNSLPQDRFIFIHYKQLLSGEKLDKISEVLGCMLNSNFISKDLNRVRSNLPVSYSTEIIYNKLCSLANYKPIYQ